MREKLLGLWGLPEGAGVRQRPDTAGDGLKMNCLLFIHHKCVPGGP